ncbi:MAG: DUF4149 domain-containing protein [Nitrospiraceae bacterium]
MTPEAWTPLRWRLLVLCATVEMLSLAVWIGGLIIIIADVIPAVFNSFGGTEPGGRFLTRVFSGYSWATLACLLCLGVATGGRIRLNRRIEEPLLAPGKAEVILTLGMIVLALLIGLWLHPAAMALQEQAFTAKDEATRKSAWDSFFFMTHTVARPLYLVNLSAGVALMVVKVRTWLSTAHPAGRPSSTITVAL